MSYFILFWFIWLLWNFLEFSSSSFLLKSLVQIQDFILLAIDSPPIIDMHQNNCCFMSPTEWRVKLIQRDKKEVQVKVKPPLFVNNSIYPYFYSNMISTEFLTVFYVWSKICCIRKICLVLSSNMYAQIYQIYRYSPRATRWEIYKLPLITHPLGKIPSGKLSPPLHSRDPWNI